MERYELKNLFDISGMSIAMTGGAGILGSEMAKAFAHLGAKVAILDLHKESAERVAKEIGDNEGNVLPLGCDVLNKESLKKALDVILGKLGSVDVLVNCAGGNNPRATTSKELSFFDIPEDGMKFVFDLNLVGTIYSSQIFGKAMVDSGSGVIINISSMAAVRVLTKVPIYSAAKAGVSNFTQWLAVYMAQEYSPKIRVNAVAPGFFLTNQNRFLLIDEKTGNLTERGKKIIDHTPMGRFGDPKDLIGTMIWLISPASNFVTGVVVPVDGGFSVFSGV
ncbi:MAG: SDR family oxidoreductase [Candidatus Marinimicrobia bacterium]|nr:SDR family oxidoreductase [Candidatus Neomarinimicrobiota bacterium]